VRDRADVVLDVEQGRQLFVGPDHAAAGLKLLSATSLVGARIKCSSSSRQHRITAVSMMPAAIVDFVFFLLISRIEFPDQLLAGLRVVGAEDGSTKSKTHCSEHSPKFGLR
jgi:hypothetical protein